MWRVFGGAALVIAGIAAFIEAHTRRPTYAENEPAELSKTAYDLLRIGAWALVIFGAARRRRPDPVLGHTDATTTRRASQLGGGPRV